MSNDNRKSPFSDTTKGDEEDWDKALNAWELPDTALPKKKDEAAAAPAPPPAPKGPPLPPARVPQAPEPGAFKRAPTGPPRPASSLPAAPPLSQSPVSNRMDEVPRSFESFGEEEEDATVIARVSPELLADAGSPSAIGRRSGLGQVLGRSSVQTTPPPVESSDALLEMLFEEPKGESADDSVFTSAPSIPDSERSTITNETGLEDDLAEIEAGPEGVLADPFAPPRDERSPTLRPGAAPANVIDEPDLPPTPVLQPIGQRVPPERPKIPRAPLRLSERDLTPIGLPPPDDLLAEVERDSMPAEIRLDSVPPDSMPPPSESEPPDAGPEAFTLQGGHDLPEVGFIEGDAEDPSDSDSEVPTRNSFSTVGEDAEAPGILGDAEELERWHVRASFLEAEARTSLDRVVKARGLLVASEILSLAGDDARATELATEARDLAPTHPLTHRQARAEAVRNGDWNAVTVALQGESRSASTPAARVHGALFSAEIARIALNDKELAQKRIEQAIRAAPGDVRGYLNRLAQAIGDVEPLPKIRWPEAPELGPLIDAAATLARWRGSNDKSPEISNPVDSLMRARAGVRARDPAAACQALDALADSAGLSGAAGWLMAAVALAYPTDDDKAAVQLGELARGTHAAVARRALAAHAIEKSRGEEAIAAMTDAPEGAFSLQDRAIIGALAKADMNTVENWLAALDADAAGSLLAHAVRAARGVLRETGDASEGENAAAPLIRLSRGLAARADPTALSRALGVLETREQEPALTRVLRAELQIETGQLEALAESLAKAESPTEDAATRDRGMVAGLVFELAGNQARASDLYGVALAADARFEAAARAKIATAAPNERARILEDYASNVDDARTSALLLLEAAHGGGDAGDPDGYSRLLKKSYDKAPALPFASWLAERRARARGEFENIVEWLHERRQASGDRVEQAYDLVREALLIADRDLEAAKELLEQASLARPPDLALRELYERLSSEPPSDRASYWADRALAATGTDRARLSLVAAYEFERVGNFAEAARLADVSREAEDSALARIAAERNGVKGGRAAVLAAELLERARTTGDSHARLDAYERLAELEEFVRADTATAVAHHRSILVNEPAHLPSLSRIEQWLIGEGREDDLEPVAGELAKILTGSEAAAQAHLAMRLRTKAGPWQSGEPYVRLAYSLPNPPLWALREMEAHAALSNDAAAELAIARALTEQTARAPEIATLCLRAADAAARAGDATAARELLAKAQEICPTHLMVRHAIAELCERATDFAGAADAWETVAAISAVPSHKLDASYKAAVLWLDHAKDAARGRAALESAAQIDVTHRDVFPRLQSIFVAAGDREALASLLESRLASVHDPSERIELEVVRGRTLAEIGDAEAAKKALSFALEASPDHPDALAAFADLSLAEGDWTGAEQSLIRLARLVPDPAQQASIYARLGELYDDRLPNPERAELAYREVLRRIPADVVAQEKLVAVYRRMGDAPRAIEIQQGLLQAAKTAEAKRTRIVELAAIHELVAREPKKAEALLEGARKEFPNDVELLPALAAFYTRTNRLPALHVLLDRAAGDSRRALATGRFDVSLFAILGAVAKLRDRTQAARIAEATVAAIEGRPSSLDGAEQRAADRKLDDLLAPDLLTPAFRALLGKAGEILDAANPVDLRGLRAAPLSHPLTAAGLEVKELGTEFGLAELEVFTSPVLGPVCMPVGSHPPQIVIGQSLMTGTDDAVRRFLVRRSLKAVQARASALSRSAPIDLLPLVSAFLLLFAPDWQPAAVDPGKLRDVHARLSKVKPKRLDDDVGMLALEVIGAIGNRASTLHTVVNGWGNRVALLASGDLSLAFSAIARAAGHSTGPSPSGAERMTWINRNAEARDLAVFSVSDAYAEVRSRLGI